MDPLPLPPPRCRLACPADRLLLLPFSIPPPVQEVDAVRHFPDSKTIVDMPLAAPQADVIAAFTALALPDDPAARNDTLRRFVEQASNKRSCGCPAVCVLGSVPVGLTR